MTATLYLGSHQPSEPFWSLGVPLCVSRRRMPKHKIHRARAPWILDSGGFSEIDEYGEWRTTEDTYVTEIQRWQQIGQLAWVAPQDWMCEPKMVARTGLTVLEHQLRTVRSFVSLRQRIGSLVIPVLQGYAPREYDRCVSLYHDAGVDLAAEPVVGLGSVCRRSRTHEIIRLVRYLADHNIRFHGFGIKGDTFRALRGVLASADSMAWSFAARRAGRDSNSPTEAMTWRTRQLA